MKKYILFGDTRGIGGWQLYTLYRAKYLNGKNYKIFIISWRKKRGTNQMKEFSNFDVLNNDAYFNKPYLFTKLQLNRLINRIKAFIDYKEEDEICIESTTVNTGMWGEILAKQFSCSNYMFLLNSFSFRETKDVQDFIKYKFSSNQAACISKEAINGICAEEIIVKSPKILVASWEIEFTEEIDEKTRRNIEKIKNNTDYTICYFGSLDKIHFLQVCKEIKDYATKHHNSSFAFFSYGSSRFGKVEKKQKRLFLKCRNCKAFNIKESFPLYKYVFDSANIIIASHGSSLVPYKNNYLVITLKDDYSSTVQGILGYTVKVDENNNFVAKEDTTISASLTDVFFKKKYLMSDYLPFASNASFSNKMNNIDLAIKPFRRFSCDYYDIDKISTYFKSERMIKRFCALFGYNIGLMLATKILSIYRKIKKQ